MRLALDEMHNSLVLPFCLHIAVNLPRVLPFDPFHNQGIIDYEEQQCNTGTYPSDNDGNLRGEGILPVLSSIDIDQSAEKAAY